jgi:hypothetical protein
VDLSIPCRLGTPAYILQAKIKDKVCVHTLPRAIAILEPASLLREGFDNATCPRLQTPPLRPGGLRCCHVPRSSGPLAIQEGTGAATRPSAPDHASPLRRDPALTCVLRLRTASTSVVGSAADTYPMAIYGPRAVEEGLAATACIEARVFLRHARVLPRHLQDVWEDDVIMTCKPCRLALQHHAIVHHRADNLSQAWCYSAAPCC